MKQLKTYLTHERRMLERQLSEALFQANGHHDPDVERLSQTLASLNNYIVDRRHGEPVANTARI